MNRLLTRIYSVLHRIWFSCCYRWTFKHVGSGTFMFRPFRVDGVDGMELGSKTIFQRGAWLYCCGLAGRSASLTVGDGCVFGYNNHITAVSKVVIGSNVLTANNVYISDNIHGYEDISLPIMQQPVQLKREVVIGDGSWIGENACIIGACVGKHCVIGANSTVTRDVPDYSIAVGCPAEVIKQYNFATQKWERRK